MQAAHADQAHLVEQLARAAIARGCAFLQDRNAAAATAWLDRAHRLVPADPTASLLLARALSDADPERAKSVLLAASRRHPAHRTILAALAAAALRRGDANEAAVRLHALLSRCAPPIGKDFAELASRIARETGAPGWIGLSASGMLRVEGQRPTVLVGGVRQALPSARGGARSIGLAHGWQRAGCVAAHSAGRPLLGSPIDIAALLAVEGCITERSAAWVRGWAWHPNDPDVAVRLEVIGADGQVVTSVVADQATPSRAGGDGVERRCGFAIGLATLPDGADRLRLELRGPEGSLVPGGPLLAAAHEAAAARAAAAGLATGVAAPDPWRPLAAGLYAAVAAPDDAPGRQSPVPGAAAAVAAGFDVIVLADGAIASIGDCLDSVAGIGQRIFVAADGRAGPELRRAAGNREATWLIEPAGPAALINHAIRHMQQQADAPRHLLLLTGHCIVPRGMPDRLAALLADRTDAGVVQPLCFAVPPGTGRRLGDAASAWLDATTRRCNAGQAEPLRMAAGPDRPAACVAISHACLSHTGPLRDEAFAGWSAALADFSLRAGWLGWRSWLACDAFIRPPSPPALHSARAVLNARDAETLERLHPGIGRMLQEREHAEAGADARRRLAAADWACGTAPAQSIILVTHALGGGVERCIAERAAAIRRAGGRAIVIRPGETASGDPLWCVSDGPEPSHPDLQFRAPDELQRLAECLRNDRAELVELHHPSSHPDDICALALALGIPYDVVVHDFAMICPRVKFVGGFGRYCGEPADVTECDACVADHGVRIGVKEPVAELRARTARMAAGARRVIAPSADTARRISRLWGAAPPLPAVHVEPWEDDVALAAGVPRQPARARGASNGAPITVCVAGAIGEDKGYDILLACARDASRRRLNLTFNLVGHTSDDERLMETGRVFITGRYEEHEAVALIRAQGADIGFLPSIWPETWCFALSSLWRAGLWTVAFAIGAPAERIAATGAGRTVPLGMPANRLNDIFVGIPARAAAHG